MVDSLKHPRRDLAGQLNPGGGLAATSPRCSRTAPPADGVSPPPPASPWLELARAEALACVGAGGDVLKVPAQPASAVSSVSSAATASTERPAERGAIQSCSRTGEPPNRCMSQLSALSGPAGIPLAKRLPGGFAGPFPRAAGNPTCAPPAACRAAGRRHAPCSYAGRR